MASWYGPDFHGKATANGEKFDTLTMTAAHRSLPMPSIVKVTNLENGISAVVKINDRGPFVKDRIIDLSQKTAEILGMKEKGSAMVRVEIMSKESRAAKERALKCQSTDLKSDMVSKDENDIKKADEAKPVDNVAPAVADAKPVEDVKPAVAPMPEMSPVLNDEFPYYVQVGAFVSEIGANKVQELLKQNGVEARVAKTITAGENWFKVRIGSFRTREDAISVQERVNNIVEDTDARVIEKIEDDTNSFKWTQE
ncbi:MAG: septal ring lytic transglycosylase RlpA family protein [Rickettsiales bacterium]|nr:septal ring lytic transglycosylase RlpA family protein [Rickettsiales bacterium]